MMRITVIHNPTSGFDHYSKDALLNEARDQGYEPVYQVSKADNLASVLKNPGGFVLVAGGDGTIGKVAKYLAGRDIPVALFPLGTANNVAKTLTAFGHNGQQIPRRALLHQTKAYDVGHATGTWGEQKFLEAVGCGLFADHVAAMASGQKKERSSSTREDEIRYAFETLRDIVHSYRACAYRVTLDGEDHTGRYLFVEAMNIRSIGPNIELATEADPGDGLLDVVFLAEDDRELLADYIECRLQGKTATLKATIRRAKHITITPADELKAHIDDELVSLGASASLEVRVQPGELKFLVQKIGTSRAGV
jgi:diacylglycerol kinase (ATP)